MDSRTPIAIGAPFRVPKCRTLKVVPFKVLLKSDKFRGLNTASLLSSYFGSLYPELTGLKQSLKVNIMFSLVTESSK